MNYPADIMDFKRMNRSLRHRLRNLCAGVKMTMDRITPPLDKVNPNLGARCAVISSEMDALQSFTDRMDLLFDDLKEPVPMSLFELVTTLRDDFSREFPFNAFLLDGPEENRIFSKGSYLLSILRELVRNAAEASTDQQPVKFNWQSENGICRFRVVSAGQPFPSDIPLNPPVPFYSPRSRHDGIGLAVAHRLSLAAGARLEITFPDDGIVCAELALPPENQEK